MKLTKVLSCVFLTAFAACLFTSANAQSERKIYLNEGFGSYATNLHSIEGYTIADEAYFNITDLNEYNKGAYFTEGASPSITKTFEEKTDARLVLSMVVQTYGKLPSFNVNLMDGTSPTMVLAVNSGKISLNNNKSIGYIGSNKTTRIDLVMDNTCGRVSVYIDGRMKTKEWSVKSFKKSYDGISVVQNSSNAPFAIDNISVYSGKEPDKSIVENLHNKERNSSLFINQDPSDYTYFHSEHILNANKKYIFSTFSAREGNEYVAERLDYKNPEKGTRIILTKNNDDTSFNDVYVQTVFRERGSFLPQGRSYKYYMLDGKLTITDESIGGEIMMLRDAITSGATVDFKILMKNGNITTSEGEFLFSMEVDTEYHIQIFIDLDKHLYDMYVDKKAVGLDIPIRNDLIKPTMLRNIVSSGKGSWILRDWEFTGLAKPFKKVSDEDGNVSPVVTPSSQFPDDNVVKNYLADKIVFHGEANVLYKNNEKIPLSAQSVYENNDLYVPIEDFNKAYDITLEYKDGKYTDGTKEYTCETDVKTGDIMLVPSKALSKAIGKAAKHSGYGCMVISGDDEGELVKTSDKEMPWFDNIFYAETGYPILSFTDAQEISNLIFFDRPTASQLQEDFTKKLGENPSHPRLMVTSDDVTRLRELRKTDAYFENIVQGFLESNEQYLSYPDPTYKFDDNMRTKSNAEQNFQYNRNLALCYLLTGDTKYSDKVINDLMCVSKFPDLNAAHIIDTGVWLRAITLSYDWCYDAMTDEEREAISEFILEKGVRPLNRAYYAKLPSGGDSGFQQANWFVRWKSNYTAFVQGGLVPACLVVAEKDPEVCFDTLEKTFRAWEYMLFGMYPGGVWLEGKVYQQVVQGYMAVATASLESALGSTYKLLEYPGVYENFHSMMAYGSLTASFSFADDTHRDALAGINDVYQYYAKYYDDDVLSMWRQLKLPNEYSEKYAGLQNASNIGLFDIIYYTPPAGEEVLQNFKKVNVFEGGEIFTLHENWLDKDALFFAAAGGPTRCYHMHNDGGDFIFCKDGEMWTYEFGQGNYNVGSIYTRYSGRTEAHNTLTINPSDKFSQKEQSFAPIMKYEEGDAGAYVVYDMTELYEEHQPEYVHRGFYIGENYESLTVRDEMKFTKDTIGYWVLHTDADVHQISDNKIIMSKNGKSMIAEIVCEGDSYEYKIETGKARPFEESPKVNGDGTAQTNINQFSVRFEGKGETAITVRMSDTEKSPDTTPISAWKAPSKAEVENSKDFGYDIYINGVKSDDKTIIPMMSAEDFPSFEIVPYDRSIKVEYTLNKTPDTNMWVKLTSADGKTSKYTAVRYSQYSEAVMKQLYDLVEIKAYDVSFEPETANNRTNMFDNDFSTRYTSYYSGSTATFDLGEPTEVDGLAMGFWKGDQREYYFELEVSNDGENFTNVGTYTSSGVTEQYEMFTFPREKVRYIRFVGRENSVNDVNNILELRVIRRK